MNRYILILNGLLFFSFISCVSVNKNNQNKIKDISRLLENITAPVYFDNDKKVKCFGINLFNSENNEHTLLSQHIDIFNVSGTQTEQPFFIIKIQNKNEEIILSELYNFQNPNKKAEEILMLIKTGTPRKLINTESLIIPMQKQEHFFDYSSIKTNPTTYTDSVILNVKTKPIKYIFDKPYIILYRKLGSEKPYKTIFHLSAENLIEDVK